MRLEVGFLPLHSLRLPRTSCRAHLRSTSDQRGVPIKPGTQKLVRDHAFNFWLVGLVDQRVQIQTSLCFLSFGRKDMAHEGVSTLHPTAGGLLEALGSAAMGLQFWHSSSVYKHNPQQRTCAEACLSICESSRFRRLHALKSSLWFGLQLVRQLHHRGMQLP